MWFFISCAVVQSGKYVQLDIDTNLDTLAKTYGISKWVLQENNSGKQFRAGEWIFIPLNAGIIGSSEESYGNANDPKIFLENGDLLWPVPSCKKISSPFGKRWGKPHQGIDIPGREGSHILSAESGIVVYSGNDLGGYGNTVVVAHANGLFTVYAHAKKNFVQKGQIIHRGQVISQVGHTGRSTGDHLHFEVRKNSTPYNPILFVSQK